MAMIVPPTTTVRENVINVRTYLLITLHTCAESASAVVVGATHLAPGNGSQKCSAFGFRIVIHVTVRVQRCSMRVYG